jgi:GH18 family chitinase
MPIPTNTPASSGWCSPSAQLTDDFLVIGYLPEYRQLNPAWGNCLTDLIYFSIQPMPDGGLDTSVLNVETLQALQEMRSTYGTRIHISIGGWERSDGFAPMATRPRFRQKFVDNLTSFCLENGLDGVDFDWEFPENEQEIQAYAALLTEVKAAFMPYDLIVSVAPAPTEQIDLASYAAADRIHIMSYDRGSKHATPEQAQQNIETFIAAGVSQERLILGIPFYGRSMTPPYTSYSYAEIMALYHPKPILNEIENIYFNGIWTIRQKTCLAKTMGLGGVMIWELGQDSADDTSLLRAVYMAAINNCGN